MQPSPSSSLPKDLRHLTTDPHFSKAKGSFKAARQTFLSHGNSLVDLQAYEERNDEHTFTALKGLVSPRTADESAEWNRSDTYFTDFAKHTSGGILSTSERSYIIATRESCDIRQYHGHEKATTMSYIHLLAIPKDKVYNAVALEGVDIITEMKTHFEGFWASPGSLELCIEHNRQALMNRKAVLVKEAAGDPKQIAAIESDMQQILADADNLATKAKELAITDFVFGYHAHPHHTVGHLHRHILAAPSEFRIRSTDAHDWKTIPEDAVLEVLQEEVSLDKQS